MKKFEGLNDRRHIGGSLSCNICEAADTCHQTDTVHIFMYMNIYVYMGKKIYIHVTNVPIKTLCTYKKSPVIAQYTSHETHNTWLTQALHEDRQSDANND